MKYTHAQKISAKNAADRQVQIALIHERVWQEKWELAINPFIALQTWIADKPIRDAVYGPLFAARALHMKCTGHRINL